VSSSSSNVEFTSFAAHPYAVSYTVGLAWGDAPLQSKKGIIVSDRQGGNHRKAAPGSPVRAIAGAAMIGGIAAAGAAWGVLGPGATTAEAQPACSNCTFNPITNPLPPPNTPQYQNILEQLPQSGLGINPQTCPGGNCYQPVATTFFPISGQSYTTGSFATGNPASPTQTCTSAKPCTVPSTANFEFPLVANSSGTSTTAQLPVFMI
jgi:hypothetical protein